MAPTTVLASVRDYFQREAPLGSQTPYEAPISPGMLLEMGSDGTVLPHSTAGAAAGTPVYVAIETVLPVTGGGINDTFETEGDAVPYHIGLPGEKLYMLLAAGEDVQSNAKLTSDGAGALQAVGGGTALVVSREAVDNAPGSGGLPVFILVEVL